MHQVTFGPRSPGVRPTQTGNCHRKGPIQINFESFARFRRKKEKKRRKSVTVVGDSKKRIPLKWKKFFGFFRFSAGIWYRSFFPVAELSRSGLFLCMDVRWSLFRSDLSRFPDSQIFAFESKIECRLKNRRRRKRKSFNLGNLNLEKVRDRDWKGGNLFGNGFFRREPEPWIGLRLEGVAVGKSHFCHFC